MKSLITDEKFKTNVGLAEMLKGGVIMDVISPEQAKICEDCGAIAVMALEEVPADIRKSGKIARMADPEIIQKIIDSVSIPVMAKVRIGHTVEAQILEELGVDFIDESEVLSVASEEYIDKFSFKVPFVSGCINIFDALRRIKEGASLIRTKGEAGTGNVIHAVKQMRTIKTQIEKLKHMEEKNIINISQKENIPLELINYVKKYQKFPVPNFAAGGIATPADAALMMQLGAESIFVGSGIFKSGNPSKQASAIVSATTHFDNKKILTKVSKNLGHAMKGVI